MVRSVISGIRNFLLLLVLPGLVLAQPVLQIDQARSAALVRELDGQTFTSFDDFLSALLAGQQSADPSLRNTVQKLKAGDALSEGEQLLHYRLLGLYARLRYGNEAIGRLGELVAIPTFRVEDLPQHENPAFHRLAESISAIAGEFGLPFRNIDQRVYEITLSGATDELIGLHAHGDVVPANAALWELADGTRLEPYRMTRIGDRLYGRGTEDDKNGIIVTLYAMKVLQEAGLPLQRTLRLLVDTTEETSSDAIPYYFARNPTPDYNLALDGAYPVIIAEKGYGTVNAAFPLRAATGEGAEVLSVSGGLASNQIPAQSVAVLATSDAAALADRLTRAGADFVFANGGNFSITAQAEDAGQVRLTVAGVSAHSSEPQNGVNPVSRMFAFLDTLNSQGLLRQNHITDAAAYASDNWGLDYLGNTLGIAFSDEFMGPLTTAQTFVGLDEEKLQLTVNLRIPVGRELEDLQNSINSKLQAWARAHNINVVLNYTMGEPMFRNPEGLWVNALLDVATENLGLPRQFLSSSGGTSVHNLPNGVQFGLAVPGNKYTGHNANEFKRVEQFLLDLQIVTEMMARLGSMPQLQ